MSEPVIDLQSTISGAQLAHRRLRVGIGDFDEELARRATRLPGWTVGHVLTHLARNADSHVRILEGALAGEHLVQYEGGFDQRAADIEAGSSRESGAIVDDVISSFVRLEDTWEKMTPEAWDGFGRSNTDRVWPCRQLPFFRWREVEMHHVDAGIGYEPHDWPAEYVSVELALATYNIPDRVDNPAQRAGLLAWLVGRGDQPQAIDLKPWMSRPEDYLLPHDPA